MNKSLDKISLIFLLVVVFTLSCFAQSFSPVSAYRVPNATTTFGTNLPVGSTVYNVDTDKIWATKVATASTATLTSAASNFSMVNGNLNTVLDSIKYANFNTLNVTQTAANTFSLYANYGDYTNRIQIGDSLQVQSYSYTVVETDIPILWGDVGEVTDGWINNNTDYSSTLDNYAKMYFHGGAGDADTTELSYYYYEDEEPGDNLFGTDDAVTSDNVLLDYASRITDLDDYVVSGISFNGTNTIVVLNGSVTGSSPVFKNVKTTYFPVTYWNLYGADTSDKSMLGQHCIDLSFSTPIIEFDGDSNVVYAKNVKLIEDDSTLVDISTGLYALGNGWGLRRDAPTKHGTVGYNSVDLSYSNNVGNYGATGSGSFAVGTTTLASGTNSAAFGNTTIASASYSFAAGTACTASGQHSTAFGSDNKALGTGSFVVGRYDSAQAQYSSVISYSSDSYGAFSSIIGGNSNRIKTGSDYTSIVSGNGNTINANLDYSVIIGGNGITATEASTVYVPNLISVGRIMIGTYGTAASAANVGSLRYRSDANNSWLEMSMQTGASTYAWVVIKTNTW